MHTQEKAMTLNANFFANLKAQLDRISPDSETWIANAAKEIDTQADAGNPDYVRLRNHLRQNPTSETYLHEMEEIINGRAKLGTESDFLESVKDAWKKLIAPRKN